MVDNNSFNVSFKFNNKDLKIGNLIIINGDIDKCMGSIKDIVCDCRIPENLIKK